MYIETVSFSDKSKTFFLFLSNFIHLSSVSFSAFPENSSLLFLYFLLFFVIDPVSFSSLFFSCFFLYNQNLFPKSMMYQETCELFSLTLCALFSLSFSLFSLSFL